jgi:hypothetical protein
MKTNDKKKKGKNMQIRTMRQVQIYRLVSSSDIDSPTCRSSLTFICCSASPRPVFKKSTSCPLQTDDALSKSIIYISQ